MNKPLPLKQIVEHPFFGLACFVAILFVLPRYGLTAMMIGCALVLAAYVAAIPHRFLILSITILLFVEAAFAQTASTTPVDDSPAGVGIALVRKDGHFYVGKLLPDSAAIESKLIHEGYRILAVGDGTAAAQSVSGRTIEDVVTMIRGKTGTRVRLTVVATDADDSAAREVLLTRGKLKPLNGLHLDGRLLNPGSQAPVLPYLRLNDQQQVTLATTHRGKIVVLEFWATWCGPCQQAMADLQKTAAKFSGNKDKLDFLTISIDGDDDLDASKAPATIAKVTAHLKQKGWTHTINGWSTSEQLNGWRISAVPTTYIVGADGKIILVSAEQKLEDVITGLLTK